MTIITMKPDFQGGLQMDNTEETRTRLIEYISRTGLKQDKNTEHHS